MADIALLSDSAESNPEVIQNKDLVELSSLEFKTSNVTRVQQSSQFLAHNFKKYDNLAELYSDSQQQVLFNYFVQQIQKLSPISSPDMKYIFIQMLDQALVGHQIFINEGQVSLGPAALLLLQKSVNSSQYLLYPGAVIGIQGQLIDNNNNLYLSVDRLVQNQFKISNIEVSSYFSIGYGQFFGASNQIVQTVEQIVQKNKYQYFVAVSNFNDVNTEKQMEVFIKRIRQIGFQYKTEIIIIPGSSDIFLLNPELPKQIISKQNTQYIKIGQNPLKITIHGITLLYIDYPWNQVKFTMNVLGLSNQSQQSLSTSQSQLQSQGQPMSPSQSVISSKIKIKPKTPQQIDIEVKQEQELPESPFIQQNHITSFFDSPIRSSQLPEYFLSADTKRAQVYTAMMLLSDSIIPQLPSPVPIDSTIDFSLGDVNIYIYGSERTIQSTICDGAIIAGIGKSTLDKCDYLSLTFSDQGVKVQNFGWND